MECGRAPGGNDRPTSEHAESNGELDEDPARFLDTRWKEGLDSGQGETPAIALAIVRIRAIRSLDLVETWLDYEESGYRTGRERQSRVNSTRVEPRCRRPRHEF